MSLYGLIFDFFSTHVFLDDNETGVFYLSDFGVQIHDSSTSFHPMVISYQEWLCHTASIISISIIVILCCLFVYKIIKLIGGLIR